MRKETGRGSQGGESKATHELSWKPIEERVTKRKELSNMANAADKSKPRH